MMESPVEILPEISVPVMTVPNPFMLNTRSTGSLNKPTEERLGIFSQNTSSVFMNSGIPSPVTEDTGTMGDSSKKVP